ncbi:MAG: hypothetical protein KIT16_23550 [Rhodospirillaceae bacterium]|nr:hypothetical protein [Rhodospirillaceae bacterium]
MLFAAAAVSLHLWGMPLALESIDFRTLRHGLGLALLIGLVLEPLALRIKFREALRDIHGGLLGDRDADSGPRSLGMVMAWFIHLVVASMMLLLALQSLGYGPRTYPFLYVAAATVLVLREMYLLGLIIVPPDREARLSGWRIALADFVLLCLAVATYAAARTVLVQRLNHRSGDLAGTITDGVVAAILFALMLVAVRFGFLVEEGIATRGTGMRAVIWLVLLVALAAAMLPFVYMP